MRFVLALESRLNALYHFLGSKHQDKSDFDEHSISRTENNHRTTVQTPEEEDDVFGHRVWISEHNRVAMDTQIFEENK
ncbi:hypothetical protein AB833_03155 [Chromatiales bacterium (ex Bugula neritina AB1)]|nr:hypothetical protein AB833_03155 [Chromatiales bacterium (ex Bugula neritina AB1)]